MFLSERGSKWWMSLLDVYNEPWLMPNDTHIYECLQEEEANLQDQVVQEKTGSVVTTFTILYVIITLIALLGNGAVRCISC